MIRFFYDGGFHLMSRYDINITTVKNCKNAMKSIVVIIINN